MNQFEAHFEDRTMAYHGSPYATRHNLCQVTEPARLSFKVQASSTDGCLVDHASLHPRAILLINDVPQQQGQEAVSLPLGFIFGKIVGRFLDVLF